jgi:hypothetical protein
MPCRAVALGYPCRISAHTQSPICIFHGVLVSRILSDEEDDVQGKICDPDEGNACRSFAESVLLIVPYRCEAANLSTNLSHVPVSRTCLTYLSLSMFDLHSLFYHSCLRHPFFLFYSLFSNMHSLVYLCLSHLIYLKPCSCLPFSPVTSVLEF